MGWVLIVMALICAFIALLAKHYEVHISEEADEIIISLHPKRAAVRLQFFNSEGEIKMLKLTDTQKCTVSIQPVNIKGKPAPVDGVPVWGVSVDGIVSLFPAADGMSCDVVSLAIGTCQVNVTADADLSAGVKNITGGLDVEVTASEAVGFAITTGAVVEQTA